MNTFIVATGSGPRKLTAVELAHERYKEDCHVRLAKRTNGVSPDLDKKKCRKGK